MKKISRNDPCPCNSGRKYKHCCQKHEAGTSSAPSTPSSIYFGIPPDRNPISSRWRPSSGSGHLSANTPGSARSSRCAAFHGINSETDGKNGDRHRAHRQSARIQTGLCGSPWQSGERPEAARQDGRCDCQLSHRTQAQAGHGGGIRQSGQCTKGTGQAG